MTPIAWITVGAGIIQIGYLLDWLFSPRPLNQLTRVEQKCVDKAYAAMLRELRADNLEIRPDHRAEAVIDSIATGILDSRGK